MVYYSFQMCFIKTIVSYVIFRYAAGRVSEGAVITLSGAPSDARERRSTHRERARRERESSDEDIGNDNTVDWTIKHTNILPSFLWISRSITVEAMTPADDIPIIDAAAIFVGAYDHPITIRFKNIAFTGHIYAVDTNAIFDGCVFKDFNLQQAYQRRDEGALLSYKFENCKIYNSTITTIPVNRQNQASPLLVMDMFAQNTLFEQTLVNLTAVQVITRIKRVIFSGKSGNATSLDRRIDPTLGALGLYLYPGVYYDISIVDFTPEVNRTSSDTSKSGGGSTDYSNIRITHTTFTSLYQVSYRFVNE